MRATTEPRPSSSPAAAAAAMVQRERPARCDAGPRDARSRELATTKGASLSGAWLDGGGDWFAAFADSPESPSGAGGGFERRGIAGNVGCSLPCNAAGSLDPDSLDADSLDVASLDAAWLVGGGGGQLERKSGMCSDSGASPPRTTTA